MIAKLINIGNSKGLRLPKPLIEKYHLESELNIEEREEGILIHSNKTDNKLSWEQTYKSMAESDENWDEWDGLSGDGIE